jgi:hypothetical protein
MLWNLAITSVAPNPTTRELYDAAIDELDDEARGIRHHERARQVRVGRYVI